jgi:hypothetical protein
MNETYEWSTIRAGYVLGIGSEDGSRHLPTLLELSEQYGPSMSTMTHRSSYEDWPRLRREAQERIFRDACQRFEGELAEKLSRADKLAVDTALLIMQTIHDALADVTLERKERLALAAKYTRVLHEAMSILHTGYGTEFEMDRLEQLEQQVEADR